MLLAVAGCAATAPSPMIATATTQETVIVVRDPLSGDKLVWFPRLPAVIDLDAVPQGAWAEYEVTYTGVGVMTERIALVAKAPDVGNTIESTLKGLPGYAQFVRATVFGRGTPADAEIRRRVVQGGTFDPIEMTNDILDRRVFMRPEPANLVGTEMIKVRGGTYTAKHYKDTTRFGELVDFWIDEGVAPIGLVKLEADERQRPTSTPGKRRMRYELLVSGRGATPQVTNPARKKVP